MGSASIGNNARAVRQLHSRYRAYYRYPVLNSSGATCLFVEPLLDYFSCCVASFAFLAPHGSMGAPYTHPGRIGSESAVEAAVDAPHLKTVNSFAGRGERVPPAPRPRGPGRGGAQRGR